MIESAGETWGMGLWLNWKDRHYSPSCHLTPWLHVCHVPVRLTAPSELFVWPEYSIWLWACPWRAQRAGKKLVRKKMSATVSMRLTGIFHSLCELMWEENDWMSCSSSREQRLLKQTQCCLLLCKFVVHKTLIHNTGWKSDGYMLHEQFLLYELIF